VKIAIIQPNLFPFTAYYDLAKRVDKFIFLDDTPYNNKSWVNKTLLKLNSKNYYLRVPMEYDVNSTTITKDLKAKDDKWKSKFLKIIKAQYKRAPNFKFLYPILNEIINIPTDVFAHTSAYSVFRLSHSIFQSKAQFTFSSLEYQNVKIPYYDKILHICKKEKASTFYTFAKSRGAFDEKKFFANNIGVSFFVSYSDRYSVIDYLMSDDSYTDIIKKECNLLQDETI
jgi:hypothetical protein